VGVRRGQVRVGRAWGEMEGEGEGEEWEGGWERGAGGVSSDAEGRAVGAGKRTFGTAVGEERSGAEKQPKAEPSPGG